MVFGIRGWEGGGCYFIDCVGLGWYEGFGFWYGVREVEKVD